MLKRFCFLLLCLLLLSGCSDVQNDRRILVSIREASGCTIENNGQRILPGEDAVFTIALEQGLSLTGTNYPGTVQIDSKGRTATLTVTAVSYPTQITLELSHDSARITYHANGGYALHSLDNEITKEYSLLRRSRPNTDTGTDTFAREGHTLVCWNTEPDGSGTRVGLGSRITVTGGEAVLYAQWLPWDAADAYTCAPAEGGVAITGYHGQGDTIVVPEQLNGMDVVAIEADAFQGCAAHTVVLPKTMKIVASGGFQDCSLNTLILFDNIEQIQDDCFIGCSQLQTLYINAIEAPFGYSYRKESCYADKVDMLIQAQGQQKLICYGGCSMWYNLDGYQAQQAVGAEYRVINMALNGTVSSAVQLQIMAAFVEPGDVLFHTPELSSWQQMMTKVDMLESDKILWCGLENNYDLFSLVDLTTVKGAFDSLHAYLNRKDGRTTYTSVYTDEWNREYLDQWGCVPFSRITSNNVLDDQVYLNTQRLAEESVRTLEQYYQMYQALGVRVYVGHACTNLDGVPQEERENAALVEEAFQKAIESMDGPVLLGRMEDHLYGHQDFYDTHYHLLSPQVKENTALWLQVLIPQMTQDGLLKGAAQ